MEYNVSNYKNGSRYEGHWKNDLLEGTGTYYHYASGSKYEGQWSNGRRKIL